MKKVLTGLALAAAFSTPAFAGTPGPYVTVDGGWATYTNADFGGPFYNLTYPNPGNLQLGGGFRFSQNLAVEGGLVIIGDSTIAGTTYTSTLRSTALYGAAVGLIPVAPQLDLFGKLGLASVGMEEVYNGLSQGVVSQVNLMYGLGAQFNATPYLGLRVQYQNFGSTTYYGTRPAVGLSTFTIGGIFTF